VRELPTGTVTFLFSDIEGSAQLVQRLHDGWSEVHAEHRRLLREAFAASSGREVDTQGDSFFVAFARARDAVTAGAAAQRALARRAWPEGVQVRARMGIHTGEPAVGDEGYLGLDVIRASRICAAGHGGQVLVSESTRALVDWDELEGISLLDLGEHHLKDMPRPERLSQLVLAGLATDFRPPRTSGGQPAAPFAGREGELARQAEAAVRDFRTSIEQTVAEQLRAVPKLDDFDVARMVREAHEEAFGPAPASRSLSRFAVAAAALLVVLAVLVWLLAR
jgi:class 3 adenylate cyclase